MTKKQLLNNFNYYFMSEHAYEHGYQQLEGYHGAYQNASCYKWRAWEYWKEYFIKKGIYNFKVLTCNTFAFTIGAYDEKNGIYYHITPSYNYKYDVVNNVILEF